MLTLSAETDGGVTDHRCRWVNSAAEQDAFYGEVGCFFYDTERPEGWADLKDKWGDDTWRSPLAIPFVSLTHDAKRFAVFPGPIMTALKLPRHGAARVFETWTKAVPRDEDVREVGKGLWSTGNYDRLGTPDKASDDLVLEMRVCSEPEWVLADGVSRSCRWLRVADSSFAVRMGYGTPLTPGAVP